MLRVQAPCMPSACSVRMGMHGRRAISRPEQQVLLVRCLARAAPRHTVQDGWPQQEWPRQPQRPCLTYTGTRKPIGIGVWGLQHFLSLLHCTQARWKHTPFDVPAPPGVHAAALWCASAFTFACNSWCARCCCLLRACACASWCAGLHVLPFCGEAVPPRAPMPQAGSPRHEAPSLGLASGTRNWA